MFSHLIEYFEYDNVDYDNIYVNNLLKILKFSECEEFEVISKRQQNIVKRLTS